MTTTVPTGNTYDKYATANPIERRLMTGFLGRLDRALPVVAPAEVLEVGIGEGQVATRVSARYPGAFITGIDLPDPVLAAEWSSRSLPAVFGDAARLPFPDAAFDLVLLIEVLEHVPDPAAVLRDVARVARRDVVLSVPNEPLWRMANIARGKYLADYGNTPGHIQHWTRKSFVRLVETHFDVQRVSMPPPWTMVTARAR